MAHLLLCLQVSDLVIMMKAQEEGHCVMKMGSRGTTVVSVHTQEDEIKMVHLEGLLTS